jgi:hypothetical protein
VIVNHQNLTASIAHGCTPWTKEDEIRINGYQTHLAEIAGKISRLTNELHSKGGQ